MVLGFDYLIDPALDLRSSVSDGPLHWMMSQSDTVFHLAGTASRVFCEKRPAEALGDVVVATRVLQACLEYKVPCVVASSAWTYPDYASGKSHDTSFCEKEHFPISENTTWYGTVKMMIEQIVDKYRQMGLKATSARFFNIYGPGQENAITYPGTVVTWMIKHSREIGYVPSPQGPARDFIYIDDVVAGMIILIKKAQRGSRLEAAYNLGSGQSVSLRTLAREVATAVHLPLEGVEIGQVGQGEKPSAGACLCRIKEEGWAPRVDLSEGIRRTVEAMRVG